MRYLPVYYEKDSTLTLTPNGHYPTPLHLTNPQHAFQFASSLPDSKRRAIGLSFEAMDENGVYTALNLDGETICGRVCFSDKPQYFHAEIFLSMCRRNQPQKCLYSAEENMARFHALIPQTQSLVPQLGNAVSDVILPSEAADSGEICITLHKQAVFDFDKRKHLADLILNCDEFIVETGMNPDTVDLCFLIHACMEIPFPDEEEDEE